MPSCSSPKGKAVLSGFVGVGGSVCGLPGTNIANANTEALDCARLFIDTKEPLKDGWGMPPARGFGVFPNLAL